MESDRTHLKFRNPKRTGFDGCGLTGNSGVSRKNFSGIEKSVWIEGFFDPPHDLKFGLGSCEMECMAFQKADPMLRGNRSLEVF